MKLAILGIALAAIFLSRATILAQDTAPGGDKYVYADFEKTENGRVVSNGGGLIQVFTGQESTPVQFKGLPNASPGAPEIVRPKGDAENHMILAELTSPEANAFIVASLIE